MMSAADMGAGTWQSVLDRIRPSYEEAFIGAGYDAVSERGVRAALSAYQRSLITPNSRFDRFLRREVELEQDEQAGFELFKSIGCATCHQGTNVGGNLFQRFGVMQDAFGGRTLAPSDFGRMLVTGKKDDAHVFRVPSLRNVALTAPYFHDGSAATLSDAIRHMGRVQLDYILTEEEVRHIVAFLHTLTGELDGTPLERNDP
jgi:cytochrome c peroxidase